MIEIVRHDRLSVASGRREPTFVLSGFSSSRILEEETAFTSRVNHAVAPRGRRAEIVTYLSNVDKSENVQSLRGFDVSRIPPGKIALTCL